MKFLLKEPLQELREIEIDNSSDIIHEIVGGYIESLYLDGKEKGSIICLFDEDGKFKNRPINATFTHCDDFLVGNVLFVSYNGKDDFEDVDVERAKAFISKTFKFISKTEK